MKLTRQQILLATSVVLLVGGGIFSAITVSDLTEQLGILEDSYENLQSDYESLELKHQRLQSSNDDAMPPKRLPLVKLEPPIV